MPSRTRYERELRRRLKDSESWPSFPNPDFALRLERTAIRAIKRGSRDGDVTAIVVFHQLAEQLLHVLIADTQFFLQVSIMPTEITFPSPRRQTFGQVLERLHDGVEFKHKKRVVQLAGALNNIRNGVVHRLFQRGSTAGLRRDAKRAHLLFDRLFAVYDEAHDDFRVAFHTIKKCLD